MAGEVTPYRPGQWLIEAQRFRQALVRSSGRLIIALDLTASREATIDRARVATDAMFETIRSLGSIQIKLAYFRGHECKSSGWQCDAASAAVVMRRLSCEAGTTQIENIMLLGLGEKEPVTGIVYVGDHFEEEEVRVLKLAATLGLRGIPLFVFHECADHDMRSLKAKPIFKNMAAASKGTYSEFKPDSAKVLKELLLNVAAMSVGGTDAVGRMRPTTVEGQQLLRLLEGR